MKRTEMYQVGRYWSLITQLKDDKYATRKILFLEQHNG